MPSLQAGDGQDRQTEGSHHSTTSSSLPAKVLITVTDKHFVDHHIVVPLPESYFDTLILATQLLGSHLHANPVPQDFSLQIPCGMRSEAGKTVWAGIVPRLWKDTVTNGDDLRLVKIGSESRSKRQPVTDLVIFEFQPSGSDSLPKYCGLAPLPRSYKDAKVSASSIVQEHLHFSRRSAPHIEVKLMLKNPEGNFCPAPVGHIRDADWMEFLALVKGDNHHIFRVTEK